MPFRLFGPGCCFTSLASSTSYLNGLQDYQAHHQHHIIVASQADYSADISMYQSCHTGHISTVGHSMHSFTPAADRVLCLARSRAAPVITAADRRWRFMLGRQMEEAQAGQAGAATAPGTAALAVHATLPPPSPSAPPSASASRKRMRPG